jgi:transketolase
MSMACRFEKGLFDPESETKLFDHNIWVIASDGDLQEGISSEASSLAGTQELGNLKVIYDDNRISIEGDTHLAFTEDVSARYRAYGWHVIEVGTKNDGNVDLEAASSAMEKALEINDKPVLIRLKTVIAWPAPNAKNTAESHGSALGAEEIAATKVLLGLDPKIDFYITDEILEHTRKAQSRGEEFESAWNSELAKWKSSHQERAALLDRLINKELPAGWDSELPIFPTGKDVSTRAASGKVIAAIAEKLPEFWGGSADLAGSNNTNIPNGGSFLPKSSSMKSANEFGRVIHFGIREHAMGAILNGITLHGLTRTFAGTFLVFSDYMRGAVRLAALMDLPVTFVWSHDSIGVGEDGPTHQPVEHLAALRAIPNLAVIRPADANEVSVLWREIIKRRKPVGLILSRQNLPVIDRSCCGASENAANGAYILCDTEGTPDAILIATGSEVSLAISAANELKKDGIKVRVISAPSLEWFREKDKSYRDSVLPPTVKARVAIEAGISQGWHEWVGDKGAVIGIDHYGASGSAGALFKKFGFTVENVVSTVRVVLKND